MNKVVNQGTVIQLGANQYVMPPISLGAIDREGDLFTEMIEGRLPPGKLLGLVSRLVIEALRRNYPEITEDEISNNVDLGNLNELLTALMSTTGLVRSFDDVSSAIN